MTGLPIDAETALENGLVTAVVLKDQLMDEAKKLAGIMIINRSSQKAAKQCLNLSLDVDLAAGLSYELKTWSALFATEDQKEGMKAFLEKRQPVYKGR